MDAFMQFKKQAKEKADRAKQMEHDKLQRNHKEAAEKRQQEQQKKKEEIDRYE